MINPLWENVIKKQWTFILDWLWEILSGVIISMAEISGSPHTLQQLKSPLVRDEHLKLHRHVQPSSPAGRFNKPMKLHLGTVYECVKFPLCFTFLPFCWLQKVKCIKFKPPPSLPDDVCFNSLYGMSTIFSYLLVELYFGFLKRMLLQEFSFATEKGKLQNILCIVFCAGLHRLNYTYAVF